MVRHGEYLSNQYSRNKREILKEQCLTYLGGKICKVCKINHLPIYCYDFHHYKSGKDEDISKMIQRKSRLDEELKKELNKCVVVCSNCHRLATNRLIDLAQMFSQKPL